MSPKADAMIGANDNLHRHRKPKLKDSNDVRQALDYRTPNEVESEWILTSR